MAVTFIHTTADGLFQTDAIQFYTSIEETASIAGQISAKFQWAYFLYCSTVHYDKIKKEIGQAVIYVTNYCHCIKIFKSNSVDEIWSTWFRIL